MNYNDALKYIESTYLFGSKPGLDKMRKLSEMLGNPEKNLKIIHVAGTNGKGSTSTAIATVLEQAGYKTGLFTSPYITDFCERIKINSKNISHKDLTKYVEEIIPIVDKLKEQNIVPTEFEIITALAFKYFQEQSTDIVVLEVGLGGRYDATNIIEKPLASVITSISLDHTKILGNTVAEIANEKAGIIKKNSIVVTSPNQDVNALEVIMTNCAFNDSSLVIPNVKAAKILKEDIFGSVIKYNNLTLSIPLTGRHQIENFLTAYEAINAVMYSDFTIKDEDIIKGFSKVRFPARMEKLHEMPLIILDGAHNPSGIETLKDSVIRYLNKKPIVIMGMLKDKNYELSIKTISSLSERFIAVTPNSNRALNSKTTAEIAKTYCVNTSFFEDYKEALKSALDKNIDTPIIICGSLYLAGEMRKVVLEYFIQN